MRLPTRKSSWRLPGDPAGSCADNGSPGRARAREEARTEGNKIVENFDRAPFEAAMKPIYDQAMQNDRIRVLVERIRAVNDRGPAKAVAGSGEPRAIRGGFPFEGLVRRIPIRPRIFLVAAINVAVILVARRPAVGSVRVS